MRALFHRVRVAQVGAWVLLLTATTGLATEPPKQSSPKDKLLHSFVQESARFEAVKINWRVLKLLADDSALMEQTNKLQNATLNLLQSFKKLKSQKTITKQDKATLLKKHSLIKMQHMQLKRINGDISSQLRQRDQLLSKVKVTEISEELLDSRRQQFQDALQLIEIALNDTNNSLQSLPVDDKKTGLPFGALSLMVESAQLEANLKAEKYFAAIPSHKRVVKLCYRMKKGHPLCRVPSVDQLRETAEKSLMANMESLKVKIANHCAEKLTEKLACDKGRLLLDSKPQKILTLSQAELTKLESFIIDFDIQL